MHLNWLLTYLLDAYYFCFLSFPFLIFLELDEYGLPFICLALLFFVMLLIILFGYDTMNLTFGAMSDKIPVRLYVRIIDEDFDDLEDVPAFDNWDRISYINRPVEISGEGKEKFFSYIYGEPKF